MKQEIPDSLHAELFLFGYQKYREGLQEGLDALEKVRGWLTRQPDRKWQAEVRGWADELIRKYKEQMEKVKKH